MTSTAAVACPPSLPLPRGIDSVKTPAVPGTAPSCQRICKHSAYMALFQVAGYLICPISRAWQTQLCSYQAPRRALPFETGAAAPAWLMTLLRLCAVQLLTLVDVAKSLMLTVLRTSITIPQFPSPAIRFRCSLAQHIQSSLHS